MNENIKLRQIITNVVRNVLNESVKSSEYIYHGTGKGQALNIQRDGFMRPNNTGEKQPSISFTNDLDYAKYYAKAKGGISKMCILRTKLTDDFQLSPRIINNKGDEFITFKSIPSSVLEVMTINGEWQPLDNWNVIFNEPIEYPITGKQIREFFIQNKIQNKLLHEQQNIKNNLNDNFWKWFSGSKLKNGNNPLTLYHGTKINFNIFKPSGSIGNQGETDQIQGIYFTDNKDAASFFSISDDDRYLKPVFLSLKNPYFSEGINELKNELGVTKLRDVNKKLKKLGYDGLIVKRGFYAKGGPFILYLAFYPNQVKSVYNDGTWDVNDNNIHS